MTHGLERAARETSTASGGGAAYGPLSTLAAFLGNGTPQVDNTIRHAVREWIHSDDDDARLILRRLRLPTSKAKCVDALRNYWLNVAGYALTQEARIRPRVLSEACKLFAAHQWPAWHHLAAPPPHAQPVEAMLWHAFKLGRKTRLHIEHTPADWSIPAFRKILKETI
jgi:hypothetical protein